MEHRDAFILDVIMEYCEQIMSTVKRVGSTGFVSDIDARDACALRLMQIGENANDLSDSFKDKYNQIPWHKITGLRNIIAHEYGNVDESVLWEIVTEDLPDLYNSCVEIIK